MSSITAQEVEIRVSSVLNKDVKQYGKQFLLDGKDETCWNSDQGSNQWIDCRFKHEVKLRELRIQFQGGFAAKQIVVQYLNSRNEMITENVLYAKDSNDCQSFNLNECPTERLKIVFNECSDLFGRIIVYKLEIFSH